MLGAEVGRRCSEHHPRGDRLTRGECTVQQLGETRLDPEPDRSHRHQGVAGLTGREGITGGESRPERHRFSHFDSPGRRHRRVHRGKMCRGGVGASSFRAHGRHPDEQHLGEDGVVTAANPGGAETGDRRRHSRRR